MLRSGKVDDELILMDKLSQAWSEYVRANNMLKLLALGLNRIFHFLGFFTILVRFL